jgi:transposase
MPTPKFKNSPVQCDQHLLFPSNVFDLLPQDHDCFAYADLLKAIDTSKIEKQYHHLGQHAYHPRHITAILIYAYSHGVFSSREIERRCSQDLAFMHIAQMNCPNFRVLGDFRKNNLSYFHDCFKQSVKMALELKMASLGHISLDGSKFKANTSKHKAMSYGRLKAKESELTDEIDNLIQKAASCDADEEIAYKDSTGYSIPEDLVFKEARLKKIKAAKEAIEKREAEINSDQPIKDKKQISFSDHDARVMGKNGAYDYSYNGQIVVDSDNQIIVAQHISQNANDLQEVEPALAALQEATDDQSMGKMSLDNGYFSGSNLEVLNTASIDAYVATNREEKSASIPLENSDRKFVKADFIFHSESDSYVCPSGEILITNPDSEAKRKCYRVAMKTCRSCVFLLRCGGSKKEPGRVIRTDKHEPIRQAMNTKMESSPAKDVYARRKVIVEPAFGHIKNNGFLGFSLRGKEKVAAEFSLVCAAYNFKKVVSKILAGLVRPKEINTAKCSP